jgi:GNAT superfamily N-acetyltransferase
VRAATRIWGDVSCDLHAARLRHFSATPAAEAAVCDGALAVVSGALSNIENGVVCDRPELEAGEAARVISWVRKRSVPASWIFTGTKASDGLDADLRRLGCREEATGVDLGAKLVDLSVEGEPPDGVAIRELTDSSDLELWLDVVQACGWFSEPKARAGQRRLYSTVGFGLGHPHRHWLAIRDGTPVGAATAFFADGAVLLENLAVKPGERRRGIGTALAAVRLREARRLGCDVVVLGPTPDSQPFYEQLGFTLTSSPRRRWYYIP